MFSKKTLFLLIVSLYVNSVIAATFTVTTNNDVVNGADGVLSLREAVNMANATAGADIINFDASINTMVIAITGASSEDANASGDFDLTDVDGVTINGNGIANTIIDGGSLDRIFDQVAGDLTINDLTIQNGNSGSERGGGIESTPINLSTLTLSNCNFLNNNSGDDGGAVNTSNNTFNFMATNCIFNQNTAADQGGALHLDGPSSNYIAKLVGCAITNNTATNQQGGGIVLDATSGTLDIDGCIITGNRALSSSRRGGGIALRSSSSTVTINNSLIANNHTNAEGGGIVLENNSGDVTITNTTISGNTANHNGGGIYGSSTFNSVTLNFVTVTGNTGDANMDGSGDGGGISNTSSTVIHVQNSIIQGNDDASPGQIITDDCFASSGTNIVSLGGNVFGNGTGCPVGTGDSAGDALLALLADNGGPTATHALGEGSAAINFADCGSVTSDQRGTTRSDGSCDAGAFEFIVATPIPTMSQWGLIILGLMLLNLSILFYTEHKELIGLNVDKN